MKGVLPSPGSPYPCLLSAYPAVLPSGPSDGAAQRGHGNGSTRTASAHSICWGQPDGGQHLPFVFSAAAKSDVTSAQKTYPARHQPDLSPRR